MLITNSLCVVCGVLATITAVETRPTRFGIRVRNGIESSLSLGGVTRPRHLETSSQHCSATATSSNTLVSPSRPALQLKPVQLPQRLDWGETQMLDQETFLDRWTDNTRYRYPPEHGFLLDSSGKPIKEIKTLAVGTKIDRFGGERGAYVSPAATPYAKRSLPPYKLTSAPKLHTYESKLCSYFVYEVGSEIELEAGLIAPWFGQPGHGTQYKLPKKVENFVKEGILVRVYEEHLCMI